MFKWIKNKLREWLGINDDLCRIGKAVKDIEREILCKTDRRFKDTELEINQLNKELDFFKSLCQIGVDVHQRTGSWAVVCLDGKQDYVNFVRLDSRDARDIKYFFKQFEKSNIKVDAPYGMVDYFKW